MAVQHWCSAAGTATHRKVERTGTGHMRSRYCRPTGSIARWHRAHAQQILRPMGRYSVLAQGTCAEAAMRVQKTHSYDTRKLKQLK